MLIRKGRREGRRGALKVGKLILKLLDVIFKMHIFAAELRNLFISVLERKSHVVKLADQKMRVQAIGCRGVKIGKIGDIRGIGWKLRLGLSLEDVDESLGSSQL